MQPKTSDEILLLEMSKLFSCFHSLTQVSVGGSEGWGGKGEVKMCREMCRQNRA